MLESNARRVVLRREAELEVGVEVVFEVDGGLGASLYWETGEAMAVGGSSARGLSHIIMCRHCRYSMRFRLKCLVSSCLGLSC